MRLFLHPWPRTLNFDSFFGESVGVPGPAGDFGLRPPLQRCRRRAGGGLVADAQLRRLPYALQHPRHGLGLFRLLRVWAQGVRFAK